MFGLTVPRAWLRSAEMSLITFVRTSPSKTTSTVYGGREGRRWETYWTGYFRLIETGLSRQSTALVATTNTKRTTAKNTHKSK